jgi:hypothetical protein
VDNIRQERESLYFDRTPGPDHYQISKPVGSKEVVSKRKNLPSFTIRKRNDRNNRQLLVSDKKQEITQLTLFRHSPGVGNYNIDSSDKHVFSSSKGFTIPNADKKRDKIG